MAAYDPQSIEAKWQRAWSKAGVYRTSNDPAKPKYYVLDMFPYPSGHGLHVGHLKGYVASDVVSRYKRMRGMDVLHPMGWDSFGLPTERQADKDGIHPREVTRRNVARFREQLQLIGLSYEWEREFATSDPDYYRWTQWIFLELYKRGLAYQAEVPVNWCPALGTVLANEEVKDGVYIETGDPVERRVMRQWMLRITAYADRLVDGLEGLDWPEPVKELQRNWIGRSEGARVVFQVQDRDDTLEVFTTRPDTLFGCSFCCIAPEHALVARITTAAQRAAVDEYVAAAARRTERDRIAQVDEKTGVFTGAYAVNPVNGERAPIWVADYVIASYGTGAVFGCPAGDERDFIFARKYDLPILPVVLPPGAKSVVPGDAMEVAYTGDGTMVNSGFLDGLDTGAAKKRVVAFLAEKGRGRPEVHYNLRDWLFSRQRYWGEPIPIVHGPSGSMEPVTTLPVLLPDALEKAPASAAPADAPRAPLAAARDWVRTTLPSSGAPAERETNVMPQWAGSCWYYLRFTDPRNANAAWDPAIERRWLPVDLYIGGIEHATLHLLYARFWHKVLFDAGHVSTDEPFQRLVNQGMVHARSFRDTTGKFYYPEEVEERGGAWFAKTGTGPLESRIEKMSKSRYNIVTPESVVEEFGADSLRIYEVFMGPVQDSAVWQTDGLAGMRRFLDRAWRLFEDSLAAPDAPDDADMTRLLHQTIRKVTQDVDALAFNTAISQMMIYVNEGTKRGRVSRAALDALARLLCPFAPHAVEEMWQRLGHKGFAVNAAWPEFDPALCIEDEVTVVVQVNGKVRARVTVARDASEDAVRAAALEHETVRTALAGADARAIFVPNRLLNLVTG